MDEHLGSIFRSLDMDASNGLTEGEQDTMTAFQRYFYHQAKVKMNIDAVFFLRDNDGVPKIPLIYFSAMDTYNSEKIAELHRLAWNAGDAPLLFIVLPDQLLIYNNYDPPAPRRFDGTYDNEVGLFQRINRVSDLEKQRKELLDYHRTAIETGEFWRKHNDRFNVNSRVDTTLMENLKAIRRALLLQIRKRSTLSEKEQSEIVHALLGRSILIKYLEERTDSNNNSVFPQNFFSQFVPEAKKYADVLVDKDATYRLFRELEEKFNGDMFPLVEQEFDAISQDDLIELQQFILGESDLASRQLVLWPLYSFNVIPIQLISSIYELFFHLAETDPEKEKGTYYTPYHLVEMLTDEVLPWEGSFASKKVLDPSCGSGIFLVEAYRRLVCKWMHSHNVTNIAPNTLIEILQSNIYGIDCNKEAIRIASFSLSLAMCDFLEPRTIWDDLQFPRLLHYNLFNNDFFDHNEDFEKLNFDIVIGNPPWESTLSPAAEQYLRDTEYVVGDKQIAQAFTWRAGELCSDGVICLLLPSKGFLFNRSEPTKAYRKQFFDTFEVSVVINYSAFRWVLFQHAAGPAVGVIYSAKKSSERQWLFYCTPKPLYTVEDRRRFMIEPNDICRIPSEMTKDDLIWKIAMWGGPRDMDLVHSMQSLNPSFRELLSNYEMEYAEGYKRGNRKKECTDFWDEYLLNARTFSPGNNTKDSLNRVDFTDFECTVDKKRSIFKSPHLIIKQSHKKARFLAEVFDFDAVFNHSFLGIHGEKNVLKYFCLIIRSNVFSYYQIMTNRRWLVERDELEAGDILDTPFPRPSDEAVAKAVELYDRIFVGHEDISLADQFVYQQYGLAEYEISLINDAMNTIYDYFSKKSKSITLKPPTQEALSRYTYVLKDVLINSLGRSFNLACTIHRGTAPLLIAELDLGLQNNKTFSTATNTQEMDSLLGKLDKQLMDSRSGSVFVKRNVRIYERDRIYIVKPNQARYWTFSSACRDADELFADVMRAWRVENE